MLYHCFPRRPYGLISDGVPLTEAEEELGMQVLESIFRFGLLLKPEDAFDPITVEGNKVEQVGPSEHPRCCFTENDFNGISSPEVKFSNGLRSHLDIFGSFAIGIENTVGRLLGINPCNYYYRSSDDFEDPNLRALSEHLLETLGQVKNTLVLLSEIEAIANPDDDHPKSGNFVQREKLKLIGVNYENERRRKVDEIAKALDELSIGDAKKIEETLLHTHYPFWYLSQQITFLTHLFQNADSQKNRRELAYYAQREWRLVRFFHGNLRFLPVSAQPDEIISLSDEETEVIELFLETVPDLSNSFRQVYGRQINLEGSWLFFRSGDFDIREFVSEIIVPSRFEKDVTGTVEQLWHEGHFRRGKPKIVSSDTNGFWQ